MHSEKHPLAGKTVRLLVTDSELVGQEYRVEDWWDSDTVFGKSWMIAQGNPAALKYAVRSALCQLPIDDEVVYGKVGPFGHLVHVSEIGEEL